LIYVLCLHDTYNFTIVGSFLLARKQTGAGKIRTCVLYCNKKDIFTIGKNNFIWL